MSSASSKPTNNEHKKHVISKKNNSFCEDPLQYYKKIKQTKLRNREKEVRTTRGNIIEEDWEEDGKRAITFEVHDWIARQVAMVIAYYL